MPTVTIDRASGPTSARAAQIETPFVNPLAPVENFLAEEAEQFETANNLNYVANKSTEIQTQLYDLAEQTQQEFFDNPQGYREEYMRRSQALYESAIAGAPSQEARNSLTSSFAGMQRNQLSQADAWERENTVASYLEKYEDSINSLSNSISRNPNAYLDAQAQLEIHDKAMQLTLSPIEARKARQGAESQLAEAYVMSLADRSPTQAKEVLSSKQFDTVFNSYQISTLENNIDALEERKSLERQRQRSASQANFVEQKERAIFNARSVVDVEAIIEDIPALVENNTYDVNTAQDILRSAQKKFEVLEKTEGAIFKVQTAIDRKVPINDQKAIDTYYDYYVNEVLQGQDIPEGLDKQTLATEHILKNTGALPSQVIQTLRSGLSSIDHKTAAGSAQVIDSFIDQHPLAFKNFEDEIPMATAIMAEIRSGATPENAVKSLQELEKATNIPQDQVRIEFARNNRELVDEAIAAAFPDAEIPPALTSMVYQKVDLNYVGRKFNMESSIIAAIRQAKTVYRDSETLSKPTYEFKPPEAVYGPSNADPKWVKEQLGLKLDEFLNTTKEVAVPVQQGKFVSVGKATTKKVVSDFTRSKLDNLVRLDPIRVDGKLGYVPIYLDENGSPSYFMDEDSQPFVFIPEWSETEQGQEELRIQEQHKKAHAREKIRRQKRLELYNDLLSRMSSKDNLSKSEKDTMEIVVEETLQRQEARGEF